MVGALSMRNIQDNTCAVEGRCKDNRRREPEKRKGRGTQKRGSGECQSCWLKTDGLREEGGMAEARAAVTLSGHAVLILRDHLSCSSGAALVGAEQSVK